ncbi:uncharacterized protein LOC114444612 [Parambassis ranga]|uniref:Glycosyltransferase family 92 protein n=1 Tax=Parambassis ranga TaxID=210632 RepID=A0A6P7JEA3_9TELE|nr:uncharacterized protein LOC114444612 [Parambassis ranga]XP_028275134.1 uncharacterized protein LOC114444612 [Parambassis ranga]
MSPKQPPVFKRLKCLLLITAVLSVLSVALLIWSSRDYWIFQARTFYYQRTTVPQHSVHTTHSVGPEATPLSPGSSAPSTLLSVTGPEASVVTVNGTKTLLLSAYLEHRTDRKEVRVIAVVLRSEAVAYRCLFCCQEQLHISDGVCNIHIDHFGFAYGTADIMCPVPSGCEAPSCITVTSAAGSSDVDREFLEVKNQNVKSDAFPYSFTVCLSTMFDFTNVLQFVQSLEMMQLLGVDRVVVYKTSCSPETQHILDYYTHKGLVEVIPWSLSRYLNVSRSWLPAHGPGDLHYFGQIAALNDCLYRYMYQSRYVALQDMDELILPQSVSSWSELLPQLEQKYGVDRCYMFENNVFPNTIKPPNSPTLPLLASWLNVSGVDILAHLYQEPYEEIHKSNFKIIVNPRAVFTTTVHGVLHSQHGCSWVDRNMARMYHTRRPSQPHLKPDQLIYDGRLLDYSARLIPAVSAVLKENGLLEDSTH